VPPLEKKQRQIEHARLAQLEGKFLPALGHGAGGAKLLLGLCHSEMLFHHNPSPTLRTGDARARNAIGHTEDYIARSRSGRLQPSRRQDVARLWIFSSSYAIWVANVMGAWMVYPTKVQRAVLQLLAMPLFSST